MELARKSRNRLSVKEIHAKYGWQEEQRSSPAPPRDAERTQFQVQMSNDKGRSWMITSETNQPVHALRLAREASRVDARAIYRAFDVDGQAVLLHFREGMAVYEERGWT